MWRPQITWSLCRHCRKTSSVVGMAPRACRICSVTGRNTEGGHALCREIPPAETALVPEDWTNTAPLRHAESSNKGSARDIGKRYRANRGAVRLERWTLQAGPPPGFRRQRGGCRKQGYPTPTTRRNHRSITGPVLLVGCHEYSLTAHHKFWVRNSPGLAGLPSSLLHPPVPISMAANNPSDPGFGS